MFMLKQMSEGWGVKEWLESGIKETSVSKILEAWASCLSKHVEEINSIMTTTQKIILLSQERSFIALTHKKDPPPRCTYHKWAR